MNKHNPTLRKLKQLDSDLEILSINTSIEAARLGKDGVAVGVIAKEMHRMSEQMNVLLKEMEKE